MKFKGLHICRWPNNNHILDSDTILKLIGPNSFQKLAHRGRIIQIFIQAILVIFLSDVRL